MFSCDKCGKEYTRKNDLKRHCLIKHEIQMPLVSFWSKGPNGRFMCVYCQRTYARIPDVKRHYLTEHLTKQQTKVPQIQGPLPQTLPQVSNMPQTEWPQNLPHIPGHFQQTELPHIQIPLPQILPQTEWPQNLPQIQGSLPQKELPQMSEILKKPQILSTENRPGGDLEFDFPDIREPFMVFKHPFTMLIVGPSGCGKTVTLLRILKYQQKMIDQHIDEILWCHGQKQELHKEIAKVLPNIQFIEGLPDSASFDARKTRICILDDLMSDISGNVVANLFSKGSHHTNTTVICILQNLFPKNKEQRDISLNTKYILVFKNPRDGKQIGILASQMDRFDLIKEAYKHATAEPFGYLMLDLTQEAHEELRVRSKIFPDDQVHFAYLK